jgi:ATP-dependent RNA helicase DDX54/DBP10
LAARGLDVPLLNNVINFHFPQAPKLFVHRCGRAARQGINQIRKHVSSILLCACYTAHILDSS